MTTLFSMTIDTEEEWDWGAGWPTTDLRLENVAGLPRFQEICTHHGVATTYFVNQAVLDDPGARRTILDLSRMERVEIGMHIHPWNTPPLAANRPVTPRETFLHNLPPSDIRAKLESVHGAFRESGLKPLTFRGGRYSSGGPIHDFLREKQFVADASVVPFSTWKDEGAPDYRTRGLEPVRLPPSREGAPPLWEIPLTLGFTRKPFRLWRALYETVEGSILGKLRLIGIAEALGLVRKVWLNFEEPLGLHMLAFLTLLRRMGLPCICFTVHSSSLMAGKNPYTPTSRDEDRLFGQLEEVFSAIAEWPEFQPATVAEIATKLEEEYHARSGN